MKVLNVAQGTPEWLATRAQYRPASEAPAMMGASKYQTRADLLAQHALGLTREVDAGTQARFDNGHAVERLARPLVEEMLGEDLFPVTAIDDAGYLLASLDGLTIDDSTIFEHKAWNKDLAAQVVAGDLDPHYYWQLEQQLLVTGAERVVFVTSDGTLANFAHMEYRPVEGRAAALMAGWKQFDADLANYRHAEVIPAAVAAPIKDLPALAVEIDGKVVASNLAEWRAVVTERIAAINSDLQTDQDFADADSMVKFLDDGEKKIDLVKAQAQSQAKSIDELFRALDDIKASMRTKRLELDKLVTARKANIRGEILQAGQAAADKHINALSARLCRVQMPAIPYDFAGVMKGKRTVQSLRDAVDAELARVKIAANALADKIDANLKTFDAMTSEGTPNYGFLFPDFARLVQKEPDDLVNVLKARISEHQAAEIRRVEAERERIRAEERQRAEREAENIRREEQRQRDEQAAKERAAQPAAVAPVAEPAVVAVAQIRHPEPTHAGLTGTALLRDLIDDELVRMNDVQLQQALDAIREIRGRKAA